MQSGTIQCIAKHSTIKCNAHRINWRRKCNTNCRDRRRECYAVQDSNKSCSHLWYSSTSKRAMVNRSALFSVHTETSTLITMCTQKRPRYSQCAHINVHVIHSARIESSTLFTVYVQKPPLCSVWTQKRSAYPQCTYINIHIAHCMYTHKHRRYPVCTHRNVQVCQGAHGIMFKHM